MEKEFVTYEIALKLKEIGFNEYCFGLYVSDNYGGTIENPVLISVGGKWGNSIYTINYTDYTLSESEIIAPLWQQAISWLSKKHNIHVNCIYSTNKGIIEDFGKGMYFWGIIESPESDENVECFPTYEKALEAGLFEALKLIKEK